jgi:hypothetical protein
MPIIDCRRVCFYSQADEGAFFAFVRSIKAVQKIEGVGESILLHVTSKPSQQALQDLEALFTRYRIRGRQQLASLRGTR